jgi:hypothetical protein
MKYKFHCMDSCSASFRDVQGITDEALSRKLSDAKSRGFINYFGMQRYAALNLTSCLTFCLTFGCPTQPNPTSRFGTSTIGTQEIGRAVLKGDFEAAVNLVLTPRASGVYTAVHHWLNCCVAVHHWLLVGLAVDHWLRVGCGRDRGVEGLDVGQPLTSHPHMTCFFPSSEEPEVARARRHFADNPDDYKGAMKLFPRWCATLHFGLETKVQFLPDFPPRGTSLHFVGVTEHIGTVYSNSFRSGYAYFPAAGAHPRLLC